MCAERKLLPIEIFTDGSSRGNPGPGGYGVILRCGEHYKELSAGFPETTNNRMELTAVIVGLEAVSADLWIRFLAVYRRHRVRFVWVKGHADNPMNNRCDQLAVAAATAVIKESRG